MIFDNNRLLETLKLCAELDSEEVPDISKYEIDDSIFNQLYGDVNKDELDSESEPEPFEAQKDSNYFIGGGEKNNPSFNPLYYDNYNLIQRKRKNSQMKW